MEMKPGNSPLERLSRITCLTERTERLKSLKVEIEMEEKTRRHQEAIRRRDRRLLWSRTIHD